MKITTSLQKLLKSGILKGGAVLTVATCVSTGYAEGTYTLNGEETTWEGNVRPTPQAGGNTVTVDGINDGSSSVYGAYVFGGTDPECSDNKVTVSNSTLNSVSGGSHTGQDSSRNTVDITDSTINGEIRGGQSSSAASMGNSVTLTNVTMTKSGNNVYGGHAQSASDASNNSVSITGSTLTNSTYVYGGYSSYGNSDGNRVEITDSLCPSFIFGGNAAGSDTGASASNNSVIIKSDRVNQWGKTIGRIYGGNSYSGDATGNYVSVELATMDYVTGGASKNASANNNTVELKDCTVLSRVYGGNNSGNGNATGNTVRVENSTVKGNIYGGFITGGSGNATGNTVILNTNGSGDLSGAGIYGGGAYDAYAADCDLVTGNTLVLDGCKDSVKGIYNFETIEIYIESPEELVTFSLTQPEAYLTVTGTDTDLSNVTINLIFENTEALTAMMGEHFELIAGDVGLENSENIYALTKDGEDITNQVTIKNTVNGLMLDVVAPVPEPSTASLSLLGLAALMMRRRRA